jgi:hypothetical protein
MGDLMLAGFRLTYEEWETFDHESKMQLLQACAQTAPQRIDDQSYESYEIIYE